MDARSRPTLGEQIGKVDPFELPEEEAYLNILRTQDRLCRAFSALFRDHGLSEPLYNALRIIGGAGQAGVPSQTIGSHMVARDPDITRLVDRLCRAGLVDRDRDAKDRRVVRVRMRPEGRRLLDALAPRVQDLHRRQLGHLSPDQLSPLNDLLVEARSRIEDQTTS